MTLGYAAGDESRIKGFQTAIKDYYLEQGMTIPLAETDILDIAVILNNLFVETSLLKLKAVYTYIRNVKADVKKYAEKIHIVFKYLEWMFFLTTEEYTRHKIKTSYGTHKFHVMHNYGINIEQMRTTLNSILVHGLDAHIVCEILNIISKINKKLEAKSLPLIGIVTNHDCYTLNGIYSPILIPLVQQAYNTINDLSFPHIPELLSKKKEPIICTNPNIIKH
jgi:hypothetical protein